MTITTKRYEMNKYLFLIISIVLFIFMINSTLAENITITSINDNNTFVDNRLYFQSPATNYEGADNVRVGKTDATGYYNGIFSINLSDYTQIDNNADGIPDVTITNFSWIFMTNIGGFIGTDFKFYTARLNNPWTRYGSSWANDGYGTNWNGAYSDGTINLTNSGYLSVNTAISTWHTVEFLSSVINNYGLPNGWAVLFAGNYIDELSNNAIYIESVNVTGSEWKVFIEYSINTPPIINILSPENNTYFNNDFNLIYNVTDIDNNVIDCFTDTQSQYNISYTINNSFTITNLNQGENIINLMCGDGSINITESINITYDSNNPIINIINPLNNSLYDNIFSYQINISDDNLYSSNTTVYCDNILKYENYTEDYNETSQILIDSIGLYNNGSCNICAEICDGHTDNIFNSDYTFEDNTLIVKNTDIQFIGDIKNTEIITKTDRISFNIEMNKASNIEIRTSKDFHKVTNTKEYGHFVNNKDKLWLDTNPLKPSYYYYDKDYLHIIIFMPLEIILNSVGSLNCVTECNNFITDTDTPLISCDNPFINQNISSGTNTTFTYTPNDSYIIDNCSLKIDNNINQTNIIIFNNLENYFYETIINENYTTYSYNISCTDTLNHIGECNNINFFIYPETITITQNETEITTGTAINKIADSTTILILIIIWVILLLISFWLQSGILIISTTFFGIGIPLLTNFFEKMYFGYIFMIFNGIILMIYVIYFLDSNDIK